MWNLTDSPDFSKNSLENNERMHQVKPQVTSDLVRNSPLDSYWVPGHLQSFSFYNLWLQYCLTGQQRVKAFFYAIGNFYLSRWLFINNIFERTTTTCTCTCTKEVKIINQLQKPNWENECFHWYARLNTLFNCYHLVEIFTKQSASYSLHVHYNIARIFA